MSGTLNLVMYDKKIMADLFVLKVVQLKGLSRADISEGFERIFCHEVLQILLISCPKDR